MFPKDNCPRPGVRASNMAGKTSARASRIYRIFTNFSNPENPHKSNVFWEGGLLFS